MNLPAVSHDKRGFTLIELLLAVALMFVVAMFMFPVGISFYQAQMFRETSDGILSVLRKAQSLSVTAKYDTGYGVKVFDDSYVLFGGQSYDSRDTALDEVYAIPARVTVSGISEIIFDETTGRPSATGTVVINMGVRSDQIIVSETGYITW